MRPACCGPVERRQQAAARSQQATARRPHGFSCMRKRDRDRKQHASEIAGNSTVHLVKMQRNIFEIFSTRCGMRHSSQYEQAVKVLCLIY